MHPSIFPNTPVHEALVIALKHLDTHVTFGLMSDDTALLISSLDDYGVEFCRGRHENMAVAMAAGYAAASGKVGVAVIGRGPGTANALNGVMYAMRSGSRVLLMLGAASTKGAADMKAFDAQAILQAAGVPTFVATQPGSAVDVMREAMEAAASGTCAALLLPANVLLAQVGTSLQLSSAGKSIEERRRPPRRAAIRACADLLGASRRPLILAGEGAYKSGARDEIVALADKLGAVVATTLKATSMFRGYDFNAGVAGSFSHSAGRSLMEQADCLLSFGASLNPRTTSHGTAFAAGIPCIQVDCDSSRIGRWHPADVAIVADAKAAAATIASALPDRTLAQRPFHTEQARKLLAEFDPIQELAAAPSGETLDARRLAHRLDQLLPARRSIVYDAGNFLQVQPFIGVPDPGSLRNTFDFASIGMGIGVAIGFAKGRPDTPTVLIVGDGGLLMGLGELETVAREVENVVVVVMNDCAYGAELHYLKERGRSVATAVFADVDFAPLAEALGFDAYTVRNIAQLEDLHHRLRAAEGPMLIDCKISANHAAAFVVENASMDRVRA